MKVRCNQCMSIFEEETIWTSEDPLYMFGQEICPKCFKGGALMDMPDTERNTKIKIEIKREDALEYACEYFEFEGMEFNEDGDEMETPEEVEEKAVKFLEEKGFIIK